MPSPSRPCRPTRLHLDMYTFFLACAALGAIVLIAQIGLSLIGVEDDLPGDVDLPGGLDLLSVRALAAGTAALGLAGLAAMELGTGPVLAVPIGISIGVGAALLTALLTRAMIGLGQSGSLRLEGAVGRSGTVQLLIPAGADGQGRVQFELQGRTVEMKAVSSGGPIPTGTAVTIVALVDGDTVEVVPTPTLKEIIG